MYPVCVLVVCAVVVAASPKHNLHRRQDELNCAGSEDRKIAALRCQADYLAAWQTELDESRCFNPNVLPSSSSLCTFPHYIDPELDRGNLRRYCYSDCATRQWNFMLCSNLGAQYREIESECDDIEADSLLPQCFNDGIDFCGLKENQTNQVLIECYATNTPPASDRTSDEFVCTQRCRNAVNEYVANTGCCVATRTIDVDGNSVIWNETRYDNGFSIGEIFAQCNIPVPSTCTSYTPPSRVGFLDCAREGALGMAGPTSLLMIISAAVSLLLAQFM